MTQIVISLTDSVQNPVIMDDEEESLIFYYSYSHKHTHTLSLSLSLSLSHVDINRCFLVSHDKTMTRKE